MKDVGVPVDASDIEIKIFRFRASPLPLRVRITLWQEQRRRRKMDPLVRALYDEFSRDIDAAFLGVQSGDAVETMPERG